MARRFQIKGTLVPGTLPILIFTGFSKTWVPDLQWER